VVTVKDCFNTVFTVVNTDNNEKSLMRSMLSSRLIWQQYYYYVSRIRQSVLY